MSILTLVHKTDIFRDCMTVLFETAIPQKSKATLIRSAIISSVQWPLFQVATTSASRVMDVCFDPRSRLTDVTPVAGHGATHE